MTKVTSGAMRTALNDALDLLAILDERGRLVSRKAALAIRREHELGLSDQGAQRLTQALLECCRYQREAEAKARTVCADLDELARLVHHTETSVRTPELVAA